MVSSGSGSIGESLRRGGHLVYPVARDEQELSTCELSTCLDCKSFGGSARTPIRLIVDLR